MIIDVDINLSLNMSNFEENKKSHYLRNFKANLAAPTSSDDLRKYSAKSLALPTAGCSASLRKTVHFFHNVPLSKIISNFF